MEAPHALKRNLAKSVRWRFRRVYKHLAETDWYWQIFSPGDDRTAYIIGLFGSGRLYVNDLIERHIGKRARYFRDRICLHRGPTSMIYSGHATVAHLSRAQTPPEVTSRILEAVRLRYADLIFLYRHPLDSLLTNWVFWSSRVRGEPGSVVSYAYKNIDDLCADLERNFATFVAFAEGDPAFFAAAPGPPFLSFSQYTEEIELHLRFATLSLRFEDFMIDPLKEFSKIAKIISVDLDLSRAHFEAPRSKPSRYLVVKEAVPRFKAFAERLDTETKKRIERIGYTV